ncbi:thioredoxin family protein [Algoriphagus boritolerans]|uniref:thioredoxin family protein n=1 Tax=Algoriphagus boritolerans TaxID=308111 RepID=UPI002FCDFB44
MSFAANAQDQINWLKFEEAIAANAKSPKMLLVDVYTDWCGWCKKMDKDTFTDPKVIAYINSNFYPVKMNAEDTKRTFEFMGKEYTEHKWLQLCGFDLTLTLWSLNPNFRISPNFPVIGDRMHF